MIRRHRRFLSILTLLAAVAGTGVGAGWAVRAAAFSRVPEPPATVRPEEPGAATLSVKFREGVDQDTVTAIFLAEGVVVQKHLTNVGIYVVGVSPEDDVDEARRRLSEYEAVEFAETAVPASRPVAE